MNPIDEEYEKNMQKKERAARVLSQLAFMSPEEREIKLRQAGKDEKSLEETHQQLGEAIEGTPLGVQSKQLGLGDISSPMSIGLAIGFGLPMIISMLTGKAAAGAGELAGAGETTQSILEFIGNLVAPNPEQEAKLLSEFGPEMLGKLQQEAGAEQNVALVKMIKEGVEKGELKAGKLPMKLLGKLKGILQEPNDAELRGLKAGFVDVETRDALYAAQSRRINRLNTLLRVLQNSTKEEAQALLPKVTDEFLKYQQLALNRVTEYTSKGKEILRVAKVDWSDAELEEIKKFAQMDEFIPSLNRVIDPFRNKAGDIELNDITSIFPKMYTFTKSLLGSRGDIFQRLYQAEVDFQLMNPAIAIRKAVTDIGWIPFQRLTQSMAMAGKHKSLTVGARNFVAAMSAYFNTMKEASQIAKAAYETGEPVFEYLAGAANPRVYAEEAFDFSGLGAVHNYLGAWYRARSFGARAVLSADQFAKTLAARSSRYMYAMDKALEEYGAMGKVGPELYSLAKIKAEEYMNGMGDWLVSSQFEDMYKTTFTDSNKLIKNLTKFTRDYPWLRVIFPYIRTPINLYKEGLKMTPLGFGFAAAEYKAGEDALEYGTTIAKATLGSIFAWMIHDQVLNGNITGMGPVNPAHYNMKLPTPYAAYGHEYRHTGPFGTYMGLIADATLAISNADPADQNTITDAVVSALAKSLANAPTVDGMMSMSKTLEASIKKGGVPWEDFLGREIAGFTPAIIRMYAEAEDPTLREARGVVDRVLKNLPQYSETLPPYRTWDGVPQYMPPGVNANGTPPTTWDVVTNMFNPIPSHVDSMDAFDKELARLGVEYPRIPDHIPGPDGKPIPISPQIRDEWAVMAGKLPTGESQREEGLKMLDDKAYQEADDEQKKRFLKQNNAYFVGQARDIIMQKVQPIESTDIKELEKHAQEVYNIYKGETEIK